MIQKTQNILLINNDYSRAGCTCKFFQGLEITLALQTHRWCRGSIRLKYFKVF